MTGSGDREAARASGRLAGLAGPSGPAGPARAAGPAGPAGSAGAAGAGPAGSAGAAGAGPGSAAEALRVPIRVRPGSGRTAVGGAHRGRLLVRVAPRAVDGRATEAALGAVAESFGVRRRDVDLVAGATSRDKVVEVRGMPPGAAQRRLAELRDAGSTG